MTTAGLAWWRAARAPRSAGAEVAALVQQRDVDLRRREVGEPVLVEQREHLTSLLGQQRTRTAHLAARVVHPRLTRPVVARAADAGRGARRVDTVDARRLVDDLHQRFFSLSFSSSVSSGIPNSSEKHMEARSGSKASPAKARSSSSRSRSRAGDVGVDRGSAARYVRTSLDDNRSPIGRPQTGPGVHARSRSAVSTAASSAVRASSQQRPVHRQATRPSRSTSSTSIASSDAIASASRNRALST